MLVNRCITRLAGRQNTSVLDSFESILTSTVFSQLRKPRNFPNRKNNDFRLRPVITIQPVLLSHNVRFFEFCDLVFPILIHSYHFAIKHTGIESGHFPFFSSVLSYFSYFSNVLSLFSSGLLLCSPKPHFSLLHSHRSSCKLTVHSPHPDSALLIGECPRITGESGFII